MHGIMRKYGELLRYLAIPPWRILLSLIAVVNSPETIQLLLPLLLILVQEVILHLLLLCSNPVDIAFFSRFPVR